MQIGEAIKSRPASLPASLYSMMMVLNGRYSIQESQSTLCWVYMLLVNAPFRCLLYMRSIQVARTLVDVYTPCCYSKKRSQVARTVLAGSQFLLVPIHSMTRGDPRVYSGSDHFIQEVIQEVIQKVTPVVEPKSQCCWYSRNRSTRWLYYMLLVNAPFRSRCVPCILGTQC